MWRLLSTLAVVVFVLCVREAFAQELSTTPYAVTWEFNVPVPMRDGTRLSTDIIRPTAAETFPVILIRTPYKKGREPSREEVIYYARHGYVVIVQDVRGRFDSDGRWKPFFVDIEDGVDARQWILKQPWSNGQVITYGASYLSMVQWLAAAENTDGLHAMVTTVGPSDFYTDLFHPGGSFQLARP
jgi:putative CocE/NonD family hydrolase